MLSWKAAQLEFQPQVLPVLPLALDQLLIIKVCWKRGQLHLSLAVLLVSGIGFLQLLKKTAGASQPFLPTLPSLESHFLSRVTH